MVCTVFFPVLDFTSLSKMAKAIAMTKVSTRLMTPMASVLRMTRKKVEMCIRDSNHCGR